MRSYFVHSGNRIVLIGVAFIVIFAALIGNNRKILHHKTLVSTSLKDLNIETKFINQNKWERINPQTQSREGYIYIGDSKGYNGPIKVLIRSDLDSTIELVKILSHSETHSYFQQIRKKNFLKKFVGTSLNTIHTIDGITGATKSSIGILNGINSAYTLGENIHLAENNKIQFGFLEIFILTLFGLAILNTKIRKKQAVKIIWWSSLILSAIFLGFIYNQPLTTSRINSFLLGFWPSVYTELFAYILVFGAILSILFTGKNHYCHAVCPFGASQELIGKLGNAKLRKPGFYKILKKIQWSITFLVIVVALFMYNPGITEYEIYGGLFKLTATIVGFSLLFIIVVSSLFIKRPWCNYLCPLDGFFKYFSVLRKEVKAIFKNKAAQSFEQPHHNKV